MNYIEKDGGILLTAISSFSIKETLECGQCFRAFKTKDTCDKYYIIAHGRLLTVSQSGASCFFFPSTLDEFENIWIPYFDLNRDYAAIEETLASNDLVMRDAVEYAAGIRILRQEFFECLISYIISQNNRIPMIMQVVKNISGAFGEQIGEAGNEKCYSFPSLDALSCASERELRTLKTGFRDRYIVDACRKLNSGEVDVCSFDRKSVSELRESLMKINGVGVKVADCVILFSLGRHDCFPTDVWIKRVMEHFYFGGQAVGIKEIHSLASQKFGEYAGFAQEYLFNYAREFKIGAPKGGGGKKC